MTLDDWLEPRLRGAPPELASAVRELLGEGDADAEAIPTRLAEAALRGFDEVLGDTRPDPASRRAALRLLAADASLTCAFEAAADLRLGAVELADRLGPGGRLGAALAAAESDVPPAGSEAPDRGAR